MGDNWARTFYEEMQRIDLPHLGPYVQPGECTEEQTEATDLLKSRYGAELRALTKSLAVLETKNSAERVVDAESPWHAYVLLHNLHLGLIHVDDVSSREPHYAPVYRGQACENHIPSPSLYRADTERSEHVRILELFSVVFSHPLLWQSAQIPVPAHGAKAAAQHYQICRTDLMDITADPAVALQFASMSSTKPSSNSTVFCYDLNGFLNSGDAMLVFPPPTVNRLYLQRGAFLCVREERLPSLEQWMFRIRFPFDPAFRVMRGGGLFDILQGDEWFKRAADICARHVEKTEIGSRMAEKERDLFVARTLSEIGFPHALVEDGPWGGYLAQSVDAFEDMVYWYAIRQDGVNEAILRNIGANIARHNRAMVEYLTSLYEAKMRAKPSSSAERLRDFWNCMLRLDEPANEPDTDAAGSGTGIALR